MVWVDAVANSAEVINHQFWIMLAMRRNIGNPVCIEILATSTYAAVPLAGAAGP
jgi:hypothetical protein